MVDKWEGKEACVLHEVSQNWGLKGHKEQRDMSSQ